MRAVWILGLAASLAGQDADRRTVQPEPLKTSITVSEKITAEVPGVVSRLDDKSLASRPGVSLDDRLRDVPGFSLFRRNSSLVAHPTTQGVSLRGIGSTGASRTLVLFDGIPANDPFGGWVYWTRFDPEALESVEISRSASSSVFGDRAMGGVVSLLTPAPRSRRWTAGLDAGNQGIFDARGGYADLFGRLGVSALVRGLSTDGYYIVPPEVRGAVDRRAGADFMAGDLKLDHFGGIRRLGLQVNVLTERRDNGTPLQRNSSSLGTLGAHYSDEKFALTAYHSRGEFRSGFSAVAANRASERATFRQQVPSQDWGGSAVWRRVAASRNLVLGADLHRPSGESRDTLFPAGFRLGGGHLWQQGLFAQSDLALGRRGRFHAGLRHDFTGRGRRFWSPSVGVVFPEGPRRWRASAHRSFRAPTLNELFRDFSVGNVLTRANPDLRPESLVGGEAGMDWQARAALARVSLFWNAIDDLVGNVTLSSAPNQIIRQRRNLVAAATRGVEIELHKNLRRFRASAAYLFVDSRLENRLRIPQVGRHQGSAHLLYDSGSTLASIGIRSYSLQFEDDLNRFRLPGFAAVQVAARRRLARGFSILASAENLLNRTYLVGISPNPIIGAPRLLRAGVRWDSGQ